MKKIIMFIALLTVGHNAYAWPYESSTSHVKQALNKLKQAAQNAHSAHVNNAHFFSAIDNVKHRIQLYLHAHANGGNLINATTTLEEELKIAERIVERAVESRKTTQEYEALLGENTVEALKSAHEKLTRAYIIANVKSIGASQDSKTFFEQEQRTSALENLKKALENSYLGPIVESRSGNKPGLWFE